MPGHRRRTILIVFALLAGAWLSAASSVSAQPRLPYQAYGSGVAANATVEALKGDVVLATAKADAQGNWMLQIPPDRAQDGDTIGFRVNGKRAQETATFRSARFSAPPGQRLTVEGQTTAGLEPGADGTFASGQDGAAAGVRPWLLFAGIAGVVLVLGVGALLLRRRRAG